MSLRPIDCSSHALQMEAAFQPELTALCQAAQKTWPSVQLDVAEFERELVARASDAAALVALHAGDLWLALACARGDRTALRCFDDGFLAPVAARLKAPEDLQQALRERLLVPRPGKPPRIALYSGRGSLLGWVRMAALRMSMNSRRGEVKLAELREEVESLTAIDPELQLVKLRSRAALQGALHRAFGALESHERTLLRQHFLDGLTIDRLAPLYGIHRSTAARRLASTRARLFDQTLRELREVCAIPADEARSLLRLVKSQLSISLAALTA